MEILKTLIWVVNLISAFTIIVLVLLQHGKGADAGAAFGAGGSSNSLFGAAGSANFLSRTTAVTAFVFFATCLALGYMFGAGSQGSDLGVMGGQQPQQTQQQPVAPASSGTAPAQSNTKPGSSQIPE